MQKLKRSALRKTSGSGNPRPMRGLDLEGRKVAAEQELRTISDFTATADPDISADITPDIRMGGDPDDELARRGRRGGPGAVLNARGAGA